MMLRSHSGVPPIAVGNIAMIDVTMISIRASGAIHL